MKSIHVYLPNLKHFKIQKKMNRFTGVLVICFAFSLLLSDSLINCQNNDQDIDDIGQQQLRAFEQEVIEVISDQPLRQLRIIETIQDLPEDTRETLRTLFPNLSSFLLN
jgi:hypothetical protein